MRLKGDGMGVTECPKCGKAGGWEWTKDIPEGKIRHKACGEIFNMTDWVYKFKVRALRKSDFAP